MKKLLSLITVMFLAGCANGIPTDVNDQISNANKQNVEKVFVGIPVLMGLEGTTVRLNNEWLLTAAHNSPILSAQGKEVYYHPVCDIALVRDSGEGESKVGMVYQNDNITHVGYPIGGSLSQGEGIYVGEVFVDGWDGCQMSATTGVIMSGMSGGPSYNSKGELVGINHGFVSGVVNWEHTSAKSPAVFVSLLAVKDWLNEITGESYYE